MTVNQRVKVFCEVKPGIFSSESAVELTSKTGESFSLFVDKQLVHQEGTKAFVWLSLVQKTKDTVTVLLPSEAFEQGSRWIDVPATALAK